MVDKNIKSTFKRKVKNMTTKKELIERVINLEILVFILMYKDKPIMVNGVDITKNSYTQELIKKVIGVTVKVPPKQLNLFRGTHATS